jgi:demethoxyubiquinone hydroxylase (CLK1/Coq7/Cat5 family)
MQDAHAGELAAAFAYRAHAVSLWRHPEQRAEVLRIEAAEWHHRRLLAVMLAEMDEAPRRRRELLMGSVGRFFGLLCYVTGWFGPMYAAGRLEAMNVGQYETARHLADELGHSAYAEQLAEMVAEEDRHERWFGDRVRGHWLLPVTRRFLKWAPPAPLDALEPTTRAA